MYIIVRNSFLFFENGSRGVLSSQFILDGRVVETFEKCISFLNVNEQVYENVKKFCL